MAPVIAPDLIAQIAAKAQAALPATVNGRIEKAVQLVLAGAVTLQDDGSAVVQSQSKRHTGYSVNGTCPCEDAQHAAPQGWCKHKIAVGLYRRCQQATAPSLDNDVPPEPEPVAQASAIPAQYLVTIQGKPFVKYAGLLALAHQRGLVSLSASFISVTPDLVALAEATVVFADGRTFTDAADATPQNVSSKVRPHFARMALTRAKARALRDALNIGVCSLEELGEGE